MILLTTIMSDVTLSPTLSDSEKRLLQSLASGFYVDSDEEAPLADACKLGRRARRMFYTRHCLGWDCSSFNIEGELSRVKLCGSRLCNSWGIIDSLFQFQYNSQNKTVKFRWQPWDETESGSRHKVDPVGKTK